MADDRGSQMIRAKLFVCSEGASVDARNNTISAFHILEQVNTPGFPVVLPKICVIALMERETTDPSNTVLQISVDSGDQQLSSHPFAVNFFQSTLGRTLLEFNGFLIPRPGLLRFSLKRENEILGSWSVLINQVEQQPPVQMHLPPPPNPPEAVN